MIRAIAGEVVTGYHIPIWLLLTIFFISLFMATIKRHSELLAHGKETRESLYRYKEHFLDFLTNTFATSTIIAYATYTYVEPIPQVKTVLSSFTNSLFPELEIRKWMMVTVPWSYTGLPATRSFSMSGMRGSGRKRSLPRTSRLSRPSLLWVVIIIMLIYIL
jgi:magnesium-transporting ATPase (P-type)